MNIQRGLQSLLFSGLIISAVFIGLIFDVTQAQSALPDEKTTTRENNDTFYRGLHTLEKTLQRVHSGYVENVDDDTLFKNAIDGALSILDPHTSFYEPRDYKELKMRTDGEFGGLGIQISIRDEVLTVMTPISGTPAERAGIRSGDKIIEISGESTKGITLEEAVNQMRGKPGTDITITISREGEPDPIDYTITRDIIEIKAIPYTGVLRDSIGYLKLNSFSSVAGDEVRSTVEDLLDSGATSIVFDLRSNPGGLLDQAVEVSNVFLDKDRLVVFTKGRIRDSNNEYETRRSPVLPEGMPLCILVNGASASASEIVSGAVQDWDRGVVVGKPTFGKGSVQTVLPIDKSEEKYLKMTTALYYTPSGRCINKPLNGVRANQDDSAPQDSLVIRDDSLKIDSSEVYYTKRLNREVYGGGGIIPDTLIDAREIDYIIRKFLVKDLFFKFANHYYPSLPDSVEITPDFSVRDTMVSRFLAYADSIGFNYRSAAGERLDKFRVYAGFEKDTSMDSATLEFLRSSFSPADSAALEAVIDRADSLVRKSEETALRKDHEAIRRELKSVLLIREMGRDNPVVQRMLLSRDRQLKSALDILSTPDVYEGILNKNEKSN
ncbi:MAG: S41 family peptidase [Fibrobacterota bacterium]